MPLSPLYMLPSSKKCPNLQPAISFVPPSGSEIQQWMPPSKTTRCFGHNSKHRAHLQTPKSMSSSQEPRRPDPKSTTISAGCPALNCATKRCIWSTLSIAGLWWDSATRAQIQHRTASRSIKSKGIQMPVALPTFSATRVSNAPTIANKTARDTRGMPEAIINFIYSQEGISNPMRSKVPKIK